MASPTRWGWVWVNSGSWWWTGRPGLLRFMGSQRVRHDSATELNWTDGGLNTINMINALLSGSSSRTAWLKNWGKLWPTGTQHCGNCIHSAVKKSSGLLEPGEQGAPQQGMETPYSFNLSPRKWRRGMRKPGTWKYSVLIEAVVLWV